MYGGTGMVYPTLLRVVKSLISPFLYVTVYIVKKRGEDEGGTFLLTASEQGFSLRLPTGHLHLLHRRSMF